MRTIDLNADVGEGSPHDAELIPLLTSANIACGGHAGDERAMEAAARVAIEHGVVIGAHPGHEDREHFGRRELPITPDELLALLNRQVSRLHAIVRGLGGEVRYLKLHGALYHQAGRDAALAEAAVRFVHEFHVPLALLGRTHSSLDAAANRGEVPFGCEAFPDRAYTPDGLLVPRRESGALLTDEEEIAAQALRFVQDGVPSQSQRMGVYADAESLCLHGDSPGALAGAQAIRRVLNQHKIGLGPFAG
ncbi:LamB/YcsF family protein [Planctomycetes bacterium MalM25]|nr:LamB/YcsF family protein [Planctomycetes bacterium MalM25]